MANPKSNNTEATAKDDPEIIKEELPLPKNSQTSPQHDVFLTPPAPPVQNQGRPQTQPVVQDNKMNVPNPEVDIKACSFETLVGFLNSNVFRSHLLAILNFLRSEAIELEFRNSYTSKYVEEVLHRIARNADNLELLTKDSDYGGIAKEIKDALKHSISNKIFMVACAPKKDKNYSYLNGRFVEYRQFLYYRKMFYPERSKVDASENASEKASDSASENTSENSSVNASEDAASVNVSESACENASQNASMNTSENAISNASENTSDHTSTNASVNTERLRLTNERRRPSKLVIMDSYSSHSNPLTTHLPSNPTKELISQASVAKPVDPNRSSIDTQSPRNKFISLCLQIQIFVKDITQTKVEFCDLDSDDASFVYTLFSSAIDDSSDIAIKAKKACIQLWEAVKIRRCDYEFSIRYLGSTLTKKSLLLEKRHKRSAPEDIFVTEPSINRHFKKSKIIHQERLQHLGSKFVMSTFRTMLEFLSDESEASVIIEVSNKDEECFVLNILNIARSNDIKSIFNDKARKIVDEVHRLADVRTSFRIIQTKSKWKQGLLGVRFAKVPLGEKDSPKQRKLSKARFEKATRDEDPPKEEKSCDAEVVSDQCPQNEDCPKHSRAWYNRVESAPKGRVNLKRKWQDTSKAGCLTDPTRWNLITRFGKNKPSGSHFTIRPVKNNKSKMNKICTYVSHEADSKLAAVMFKYDITSNKISYTPMVPPAPKILAPRKRTIEERHDQLIEALSVPVQSDKAMKMMLGMGWKGGALGARGDGITEPIIPHLNNSTAGLGHNDRQSKLKKVKTKIPKEISPVSSGRSSAELSARSSTDSSLGSLPRPAGSLPPRAGSLLAPEGYLPPPTGSLPPPSRSLPPPTVCLPSPTGSLPPRARSLPRLARSRRPPSESLPPPDPDNMDPVFNRVFRKPVKHPLPTTYMGQRTMDAYIKFFMGHLHCMVMTPELPMLRILVFQYALKKKEKEFVQHMLEHFADRFTLTKNKGKADVMDLINSVLGSLVSVTAGCFLYRAWESLIIGFIGGAIASGSAMLFDRMHVDDPVGASAVHGACGLWGVIVVGLFADNPIPMETTGGRSGLFKGGGWYLLGVQSLTALCLMTWGLLVTMALLWLVDKILPIRMDPYTELLGADITEHRIRHGQVGISRAVSALRPFHNSKSIEELDTIGVNSGHTLVLDKLHEVNQKKGVFQINNAFVDDKNQPNASTFKNPGLLNHRNGNTEYALHQTLDPIIQELNVANAKKEKPTIITVQEIAEGIKGKRYRDLSAKEIEDLGEINASQDRFRHRFHEEDYKNDIDRSAADNIRWLD